MNKCQAGGPSLSSCCLYSMLYGACHTDRKRLSMCSNRCTVTQHSSRLAVEQDSTAEVLYSPFILLVCAPVAFASSSTLLVLVSKAATSENSAQVSESKPALLTHAPAAHSPCPANELSRLFSKILFSSKCNVATLVASAARSSLTLFRCRHACRTRVFGDHLHSHHGPYHHGHAH